MSAENEEKKRGCAPYLLVYHEQAEGLPPDLQGPFLMAVNNFLFYQQQPDFSAYMGDKLCLLRLAWNNVEKWLQNGWTLSEKRSHPGRAGAPKGNQNARKKKQSNNQ